MPSTHLHWPQPLSALLMSPGHQAPTENSTALHMANTKLYRPGAVLLGCAVVSRWAPVTTALQYNVTIRMTTKNRDVANQALTIGAEGCPVVCLYRSDTKRQAERVRACQCQRNHTCNTSPRWSTALWLRLPSWTARRRSHDPRHLSCRCSSASQWGTL